MNAAFATFLAHGLTPQMRDALRERQTDMFGRDMLASGHFQTIKALERRGLVEQPCCAITELGELVISVAGIDQPAGAEPAGLTNPDTPAVAAADVSITSPVGHPCSGHQPTGSGA